MKVIVDTSIWSLVFRRKKSDLNPTDRNILSNLVELLDDSQIILIGPIKQEILTGISNVSQYNKLKSKLRAFPNLIISNEDYETAAEFYNICRKNGIQGSHTDFLICSVAYNNNFSIFTTDKDFNNYSKYLKLNLFEIK